MSTQKNYYLSKFENDRITKPFIPAVAKYGRWGMLDYRVDQSQGVGWCVACVESVAPVTDDNTMGFEDREHIFLGSDLDCRIEESTLSFLKTAIQLPFQRQTLREIIIETQLCHMGLTPDGDGNYIIHLLEPVWTATEEQAVAFAASCLSPFQIEYEADEPSPSHECLKIRGRESLSIIEPFFNLDAPPGSRLEDALVAPQGEYHSLVKAIKSVLTLIESSDPRLYLSTELLVLSRLALDLSEIGISQ